MSQFKLANEIINSKDYYTADTGSSKEITISIYTNPNEIGPTLILETTTSDTNPKSTTDGTKLPTTDVTNSMTIDDTKPNRPRRIKIPKYLQDYNEKL